jgi:hypothetical protein
MNALGGNLVTMDRYNTVRNNQIASEGAVIECAAGDGSSALHLELGDRC